MRLIRVTAHEYMVLGQESALWLRLKMPQLDEESCRIVADHTFAFMQELVKEKEGEGLHQKM